LTNAGTEEYCSGGQIEIFECEGARECALSSTPTRAERRASVRSRLGRVLARPVVLAVVACGLVAVLLAGLGAQARARLAEDIGDKARGAFDILVRPTRSGDFEAASTKGLIEPNYLSFAGSGGISMRQLEQVRAIPGVEVAAPISVVGQVSGAWNTPLVALPATSVSRVYSFTLTQRVADGVSDRVVSTQTFSALLPASSSVTAASTGSGSYVAGDAQHGWLLAALPLPPVTSSVVAVDPVAEQKLLGHGVSALSQLAALRGKSSGTFTMRRLNDALKTAIDSGKLTGADDVAGAAIPLTAPVPVVPVIATPTDPSSGTLSLTASVIAQGTPVDAALTTQSASAALSEFSDASRAISSSSAQIPLTLQPLSVTPITIGIDGAKGSYAAGGSIQEIGGLLIDRPEYTVLGDAGGSLHVRITPHGTVPLNGPPVRLGTDPETGVGSVPVTGTDESYRRTKQVEVASAAAFYPIRTFQPAQLVPHSPDEGRVSMGAYDVPALTVESSSIATSGTTLLPTLNPAGLVVREPVAIADIRDATLLRGDRPIDAIRVRVGGISTVDSAAQRTVEDVAGQIAALGLKVDVVIGSSPQAVSIDVPAYITGDGVTVDLGTVGQRWTTMGAATTVSIGLSETTILLAVLAALAVVASAASAQLLEGAVSRREAAILNVAGWSVPRIRRRIRAAPLGVGAVMFVVFAVMWWLTGRDIVMGVVGALICLAAPAAVVVTAREATRGIDATARLDARRQARSIWPPLSSRALLGLRLDLVAQARSAAIAALVAIATASTGSAVAIFAARTAAAGPTLLAESAVAALSGAHVGLLLVVAATCTVFAGLLWQYWMNDRRAQERVLTVSGWSRRERGVLHATMLGWLVVPGTLIGMFAAVGVVLTTLQPLPAIAALTALAAGVALTFVMTITGAAAARRLR
jgi:putative ABC transport system permease protein